MNEDFCHGVYILYSFILKILVDNHSWYLSESSLSQLHIGGNHRFISLFVII